jgi:hypothetical protein
LLKLRGRVIHLWVDTLFEVSSQGWLPNFEWQWFHMVRSVRCWPLVNEDVFQSFTSSLHVNAWRKNRFTWFNEKRLTTCESIDIISTSIIFDVIQILHVIWGSMSTSHVNFWIKIGAYVLKEDKFTCKERSEVRYYKPTCDLKLHIKSISCSHVKYERGQVHMSRIMWSRKWRLQGLAS